LLDTVRNLKNAEWTVDQLDDKHLEFLRNLEKDYEEENVILTHDEPCIPGSKNICKR